MTKQPRSKKTENHLGNLGKGTVTPIQIAFLVDQYLSDNNYTEARTHFRTEASSIFSKSPHREAPKTLLSLSAIVNEYIALKEQKVILDQENIRVEQEKTRIQMLLNGLQSSMNVYNASLNNQISADAAVRPQTMLMGSQPTTSSGPPAVINPASSPSNTIIVPANVPSKITNPPANKRKGSKVAGNAPPLAKRSRGKASTSEGTVEPLNNKGISPPSSVVQSSHPNVVPGGSLPQGSTVAKRLFNQPSFSIPRNSSVPQTPQPENPFQSDKSVSPVGNSSVAPYSNKNSPPQISNSCTIFSSKRVTLSPNKDCYTVETNQCISSPSKSYSRMSSRREHVKGRLNFDCSDVGMTSEKPSIGDISTDKPITDDISTSESEKEVDIFDMDLLNFEALGADFSFTEMLGELDLEELGLPCQPSLVNSMSTVSGSSHENMDGNQGPNQVRSEFSSTVTEVVSEKGMNEQGPDSMTTMTSVTKCIRIISPVKSRGSTLEPENVVEIN